MVRGDDPVRGGRVAPGAGAAGDPRRRASPSPSSPARLAPAASWVGATRVRARRGRVRFEGRRGAAARVAAPRPSRGARPRLGPDVGGHGQPRRLRDRPGRRRPARRWAGVVVAPCHGLGGALGALRLPALGDEHRPQTPAGLFDDRQRRTDAARGRGLGALRRHRPSRAGRSWPSWPPCSTSCSTPCSRARCSSRPARSNRPPGSTDLDQLGGLLRRACRVSGPAVLVGGLAICRPAAAVRLRERVAPATEPCCTACPRPTPTVRGRHAPRRRCARPHRWLDRAHLRQGHRDRPPWPTPQRRASHRAARSGRRCGLGPGFLAALCLVFGVAPFLVIPAVVDAARSGHAPTTSRTPWTSGWQIGLSGVGGMLAPALLALGLRRCGGLVAAALRQSGRSAARCVEPRHGGAGESCRRPAWSTPPPRSVSRLTRVFDDVLGPSRDLDVSHIAESRYYVEAAAFHTSLDDAFERRMAIALRTADFAVGRHRPPGPQWERAPLPGFRPRGADRRPGGAGMSSGWSPISMAAISLLQVVLVVLGGPLLLGLMRKVRCRLEGQDRATDPPALARPAQAGAPRADATRAGAAGSSPWLPSCSSPAPW